MSSFPLTNIFSEGLKPPTRIYYVEMVSPINKVVVDLGEPLSSTWWRVASQSRDRCHLFCIAYQCISSYPTFMTWEWFVSIKFDLMNVFWCCCVCFYRNGRNADRSEHVISGGSNFAGHGGTWCAIFGCPIFHGARCDLHNAVGRNRGP